MILNFFKKKHTQKLISGLENLVNPFALKGSIIDGIGKKIIAEIALKNASLINVAPRQQKKIAQAVIRSVSIGNGLQDLVPFLKKIDGIDKKEASFIASDQTAKMYSEISFFKLKQLGVKKYEWLCTGAGGDGCFPQHKELNGKIFSLDAPPIIDKATGRRGKPGDLVGCRCSKKPVISFE